jgi:transcriptional regulator with XRE-family HTH domain
MSTDDEPSSLPKSMRHKQILEAAAEEPNASIDDIAAMVPSATADLVERVLDEHGDPAADEAPESSEDGNTSDNGEDADTQNTDTTEPDSPTDDANQPTEIPTLDELSAKERAVLAMIDQYPEATQRELAEKLGVSGATVSNRVNDIDGFDWSERDAFVEEVFDGSPPEIEEVGSDVTDRRVESRSLESDQEEPDQPTAEPRDSTPMEETPMTTNSKEHGEALEATEIDAGSDIATRLDEIETRLEALDPDSSAAGAESPFEDPELVHKVVHAVMDSDTISEDEELRIIEALVS